jgi:hypothetical protein
MKFDQVRENRVPNTSVRFVRMAMPITDASLAFI